MTSKRMLCWLMTPALLFLPFLCISLAQFLGNSDALFYSSILAMTTDALKAGSLLPHWFAEANAGFGSPVMMYYAPLAYLITALITLPLPYLDTGTQLMIGIYVSQIASGITAFLWLRRSFAPSVAFIGSLLFVLLPYKLIYIYLHINLAQLWALAFLPLWMMAAEDMLTGSRRAVGAYALMMACVYYTHPLTLIAFAAVPAAYVLWFGRSLFAGNIVRLAVAHILGILLCSMQLWPAHSYLDWIHAERFFEGNYSWQNNFYHLDVVLCAYYGIVAFLVGFAIRRIPVIAASPVARPGVFWIVVLAAILFMTQRVSAFVWEVIMPLQYLQFPAARLHAAALMGVTYLICIWLTYYHEMLPLGGIAYRRVALAILIFLFLGGTAVRIYKVETDGRGSSASYLGDSLEQRIIPAMPISIYETRWGCIQADEAYRLYEKKQIPPAVSIANGQGSFSLVQWQPPERIVFTAEVISERAQFVVRQCYIPLWQAMDSAQQISLSPDNPGGLIGFALTKGTHTVEISLHSSLSQRISCWISAIALALVLGVLVMKDSRREKNILLNLP